jgi:hypothetical protein
MKALEFTRALQEIVKKLKINELLATLEPWLISAGPTSLSDQDKDRFYTLMLGSHSGYDQLSASGPIAKILQGLGVGEFFEPGRLRRLTTLLANAGQNTQLRQNAEIYGYFEKLRSLGRLEVTCVSLLELEKIGEVKDDEGIVELELADYDGMGIEPQRLQLLAMTAQKMHTNLTRLLGAEGSPLRFKYFDSGSSVLLGMQCAKEVAKTISDLMMQWWDKLKFSDFDTLDKKIEAVERAVALSEKMRAAVENGAVDPETGRNLLHRIFQEVDVLVGIGVTPPLLNAEVAVDQRELVLAKRDVKLLVKGQPPKDEEDDQGSNAGAAGEPKAKE